MIKIKNLEASIKKKKILKGINLNIEYGEIHAIMGPNGCGKSTLCSVLAGKSTYKTNGNIFYKNKDIINTSPEERSFMGIFISFQNPIEIPGISIMNFIYTSINEIRKNQNLNKLSTSNILTTLKQNCKLIGMKEKYLFRFFNENFSGGERKKIEILQMLMLNPEFTILDEIDSGLDVDSLKRITTIIKNNKSNNKSMIIITHYQKILKYIEPDYVHIMNEGVIVKSGYKNLAEQIEKEGYNTIINNI